jgi:hypothetical protein
MVVGKENIGEQTSMAQKMALRYKLDEVYLRYPELSYDLKRRQFTALIWILNKGMCIRKSKLRSSAKFNFAGASGFG